jgi:N utilization substance protein B
LLHGVVREQRVIDPLICDTLPEKWTFNRLDKVMCSILRAGIYELLFSPDIPPKVIINEYTNIGSSFQLNDNNALINGVLNSVYHANHDIMG